MRLNRLLLPILLICGSAFAATMTNNDVIKLIDAGMPDDVIIKSIANGDTKFDTSADALIKLKAKGASPAVLSAILAPKVSATVTSPGKPAAAAGTLNPEEVILISGGKEIAMQYIIAGNRTGARALGFGGIASYAVLNGEKAQRRLESNTPQFIVSVPKNAQVVNYLTLANFANRSNGTREVMVGGGYLGISSGIPKDRVIKTAMEAHPDQRRAREGFVLYTVKPEQAIPPGEYALVLNTGEAKSLGVFNNAGSSFYDFGID